MIELALILYLMLGLILAGNIAYLRRHRLNPRPREAPQVSILIPARNEEHNIGRALRSILRQDYPHFDVHVYDDASNDATADVVRRFLADDRLSLVQGTGPPDGWIGKVHALYQLTRVARGDVLLFLDADVELRRSGTLSLLVGRLERLPPESALTALPLLRGGGLSLVSIIPFVILAGIPWPLVRRLPLPILGALNGQCWMIRRHHYMALEPHLAHRDEILEDVRIGRYLKTHGITPVMVDLTDHLIVRMYASLSGALAGIRKNAYLATGGGPFAFAIVLAIYIWTFILMPLVDLRLLASLFLIKLATDRVAGMPLRVSIVAPVSYLLGAFVLVRSAVAHWTGRVEWKGRSLRRK